MTVSISDILKDITPDRVSKTINKPVKKAHGRPKGPKRVAKEQTTAEKAFVDGYESKINYRPEPQRLIRALAQPEDKQKQALEDALNSRQLAFCREYVIDFNQRDAAIRSGYSAKTSKAISHNLMQYRGITRLIELYTQSNAQKITTVDPEWVINKITEIITTSDKDGDKLRGLELIARHLGMFIERTEISGRDGEAIKIEETKHKADEVARRLREMGKKTSLTVVGDKAALSVVTK